MRERKILITLAIAMLVSTMLFALSGVKEAHAPTTETTLYIDYMPYRDPVADGLYVEPFIYPAVDAVGTQYPLYVKIARAPHEISEPALATDKTYGWQFRLSWDPTMWKISDVVADVKEVDLAETRAEQFLKRHQYTWTTLTSKWSLKGTYSTAFATGPSTGPAPDTVLVSDGLLADPTLTALPSYYYTYYDYAGRTPPDRGRQWPLPPATSGYYDLPYAENNTLVTTYTYGTITDPSYCLLAYITLTAVAVPPADYKGSAFHLSDILLFDYDGRTTYSAGAMDAYYVAIPVVPEFPLGLAPILMLAPAIPIVYLWRTRKKVMKK